LIGGAIGGPDIVKELAKGGPVHVRSLGARGGWLNVPRQNVGLKAAFDGADFDRRMNVIRYFRVNQPKLKPTRPILQAMSERVSRDSSKSGHVNSYSSKAQRSKPPAMKRKAI